MKNKRVLSLILCIFFTGCGAIEYVPYPKPDKSSSIPEVNTKLLDLINQQENFEVSSEDFESTSLKTLITLGTPEGYRLKLRYTQLGVPLVEALKASRDTQMLERLFELVQWAKKPEVRAEALLTLGSFSDPSDFIYFQRAVTDTELNIRFAGIEALQIWGKEEGVGLMRKTVLDTWSPLLQVFTAQALLSSGDQSGLPVLYEKLNDNSWIVRAMSARYLGDYAPATDYPKLLEALNKESRNTFVIAELCISALKLISKTDKNIEYSPLSKGWKDNKEVAYTIGKDAIIEVEPLVLVPPRLYIPESVTVTQTINNKLLSLLRNRVDDPLTSTEKNDPNLQVLNSLLTPTGFALQTRYSELNILLTEGLAGMRDRVLRLELISLAEHDRNPLVQATALISLAYSKLEEDYIYITHALGSDDPVVRFGAMEAVSVGRYSQAIGDLTLIAMNDPVPAFRVYAMKIMASFGNQGGLNMLTTNLDDKDWPARAMTYWYLGRYGKEHDYSLLLSKFSSEQNPFAEADLSLAVTRLFPLKN